MLLEKQIERERERAMDDDDDDVGAWVLEFLLRQPSFDDHILSSLLSSLPLPINNNNSNSNSKLLLYGLKKCLVLRSMESQISEGSVSEKILEFLEWMEELQQHRGAKEEEEEAMKGTYWRVAVDCTVRFLDDEAMYFCAVKRIWRGRVSKMEDYAAAGGGCALVSDELMEWKDDIEAAVWDPGACDNVRAKMKNTSIHALGAVKSYLAQAWKSLGPSSFIELLVSSKGTVTSDGTSILLPQVFGSEEEDSRPPDHDGARRVSAKSVISVLPPDPCQHSIVSNSNHCVLQKHAVLLSRRKHVAKKRHRGSVAITSRGIRITDSEPLDERATSKSNDFLSSPVVLKVQEELRESSLDLQAVVKDPLPEAIQLADNVISSMNGGGVVDQDPSIQQSGHGTDPSFSTVRTHEASTNEGNLREPCSSRLNDVANPNLMTRNNTARTCEWDDSIDALPEGENSRSIIYLPSPKKRFVSPLKKHELNVVPRRRVKRWSTLEEETLRTGVKKYGKGNWKFILNSYPDIFEERTEVDLKDKWRNITRY